MADKTSLGQRVRWLWRALPTLLLLAACEPPSAPPIRAREVKAVAHAVPQASHASAPFAYRAEGAAFDTKLQSAPSFTFRVSGAKPILLPRSAHRQRVPRGACDGALDLPDWEDTREDVIGDCAVVDPSGGVGATAATGMVFPKLAAAPALRSLRLLWLSGYADGGFDATT